MPFGQVGLLAANAKRLWYFYSALFLNVLAFIHFSKSSTEIEYLQIKQDIQELLVSELGSATEDKSTIQDRTNADGGGITKGMRL